MSKRREVKLRWQLVIAVAAIAMFAQAAVGAKTEPSSTISIAAARKLPLGTVVMIQGVVTVPSGAFKSSFNDDGFAIQDRAGGIFVSVHENLDLSVGQKVRVTGKLAVTNAQLLIIEAEPGGIKALGKQRAVTPKQVSTGQVGETTLGLLITVTGRISSPVTSLAPFGFRLAVNDGTGEVPLFVSTSTKISQQDLQTGVRVRVTGLGSAFKGQYQVYPRFPADVKVIK